MFLVRLLTTRVTRTIRWECKLGRCWKIAGSLALAARFWSGEQHRWLAERPKAWDSGTGRRGLCHLVFICCHLYRRRLRIVLLLTKLVRFIRFFWISLIISAPFFLDHCRTLRIWVAETSSICALRCSIICGRRSQHSPRSEVLWRHCARSFSMNEQLGCQSCG